MADVRGPHQVLVNDVLAAINAATARAQGEEAAALQRAEERTESAGQARAPVLWRYASEGEETVEDRHRAEAEELTLLEHHTPITRHALHNFLTNSGTTSHRTSSPSIFGTTA